MQPCWHGIVVGVLSLWLLAMTPLAGAGPTYYVDVGNGDDARTDLEAENPATPWRTIQKAVDTGGLVTMVKSGVPSGYTVMVQPGVYHESVESKRDGYPDAQVVIQAASPGRATIQPPSGLNGFFISHHHHVIKGFVVTGAAIGLRLGPHDPDHTGPVVGVVAKHNEVHHNRSNGIQFTEAFDGVAEFNTVYQNGQNGISYSGNGSVIHANVVYANAQFGIYIRDGLAHQVWDNAVSSNAKSDLKIEGSLIPPRASALYLLLNQPIFTVGQTLRLIGLVAPQGVLVDVYVGLRLPSGAFFFLTPDGSLTATPQPLTPFGLADAAAIEIFRYTLTGSEPPGSYAWAGVLMEHGTATWVSAVAEAPFIVVGQQ